MPGLAERLAAFRSGVADAAAAACRNPVEITTIVVTKFHPAELVRELCELGVSDFGENRHQDAAPKAAGLRDLPLTWHFVGQLQTKKVRQVLDYAGVVHSVDRTGLVDAIGKAGRQVPCFIQVNLTEDPARGGVVPHDLDRLVDQALGEPALQLLGLMVVAPLGEDPRRAFSMVRELSVRVRAAAPGADKLSMGMSADYREAIAEGATHLRIGTAITGKRPAPG